MNPILHALPVDWTGSLPANRTRGERHNLDDQYDLPFRIIVMQNGYFYTENMFLIDGRGKILQEDIDYQCLALNDEIFEKNAKDACAIIVIINPKVHSIVSIDAQMVGGPYCNLAPAIVEMSTGLLETSRKIHWNNIIGKPDRYRPNGHWHVLWDMYRFTPITAILKRMTAAIKQMGDNEFAVIYDKFDDQMAAIEGTLTDVENLLTQHIANRMNPHKDTAAKIGLGNVVNVGKATRGDAESQAPILNLYATPWSMNLSIRYNFSGKLEDHIAARNNPHRLHPSQINVYTTGEQQIKHDQYVPRGSTVHQTERLDGRSGPVAWDEARRNNNTSNIVGYLRAERYSTSALPGKEYCLVPSPTGIATWAPTRAAISTHETKPTKMIPVSGSFTDAGACVAHANAVFQGGTGPNDPYPTGTIAVYNVNRSLWTGTGNGGVIYVLTDSAVTIVRLQNGTWIHGGGGY